MIMERITEIEELINIISKLREKFPFRKFTLDGRLVGDIGEIIAQNDYSIKLYDKLLAIHDADSMDGRKVQIKATFLEKISFPDDPTNVPDYFIGLKLFENGEYEEIYNGPGYIVYSLLLKNAKKTRRGYHTINIKRLKELNKKISDGEKIKRR
jgi:hypothetical protein